MNPFKAELFMGRNKRGSQRFKAQGWGAGFGALAGLKMEACAKGYRWP